MPRGFYCQMHARPVPGGMGGLTIDGAINDAGFPNILGRLTFKGMAFPLGYKWYVKLWVCMILTNFPHCMFVRLYYSAYPPLYSHTMSLCLSTYMNVYIHTYSPPPTTCCLLLAL